MNQIHSAAFSDLGKKRSNNEDSFAFFEPEDDGELQASGYLYIVADGVGGAARGERASQYASQRVLYEYYRTPELHPAERLRQSLRQAGNEIFTYAEENVQARMATTLVAAAILDRKLTVANVGDSRAYLIRSGKIEQISRDHSLVGEMVRSGVLTEEQAQSSKGKNHLTRSLGGEMDVHVDIFPDIPLLPNDKVVLCSDGLTRYASPEDILVMVSEGSPEEAAQRMIDFANARGGADNITAIVIFYEGEDTRQMLSRRRSRGGVPIPVDIENMVTQTVPPLPYKKKHPTNIQRYIPLLIVGVVVLVALVVIGGGVIFQAISGEPDSTATSILGSTPLESPDVPIISPVQDDGEPPRETSDYIDSEGEGEVESEEEIIGIPDSEGTLTSSDTPPIQTPSDETPTPPGVETTTMPGDKQLVEVCVSRTGTGLGSILSNFDLPYYQTETYYYFLCQDPNSPLNCSARIEITDHDFILPEWWIEIPEISPEECLSNGGSLLTEENSP